MSRLGAIFSTIVFLVPVSSAQITDGGTQSIPGMISHLLGIELSNPYVLLGFTATFGIMWLSIYVIFKIGIKRFDSGYGSRRDKPLSEALGLDDKNSRNMLAVLTLLITFSTLGTGAFYGLIQGWQSLILLLFTFMLLAGLLFILIGGTGGIIGGTAYVTGKTTKTVSNSLQQAKQDIDELRSEEETIEELEEERYAQLEEQFDSDDAKITVDYEEWQVWNKIQEGTVLLEIDSPLKEDAMPVFTLINQTTQDYYGSPDQILLSAF